MRNYLELASAYRPKVQELTQEQRDSRDTNFLLATATVTAALIGAGTFLKGIAEAMPESGIKSQLKKKGGTLTGIGVAIPVALIALSGLGKRDSDNPEGSTSQSVEAAPKASVIAERDIPRSIIKAPVEDQVVRRMMA